MLTPLIDRAWSAAGVRIWSFGARMPARPLILICRHRGRAFRSVLKSLPRVEQRKALRIPQPRRTDWAVGRWLAHRALVMRGAKPHRNAHIDRNEQGAPIPRFIGRHLQLSISHSEPWVAAAVHTRRSIGVDIEPDADFPAKGWRYFLSESERTQLADDASFPMNAWVAKEAAYKALAHRDLRTLNQLEITWAREVPATRPALPCGRYRIRSRSNGRSSTVLYKRFAQLKVHLGVAAS